MRRLNPTIIALIFFIIFDSFAFYAAYVNQSAEHSPVTLTAAAPPVTWTGFDGTSHKLDELKGHVVVLHFWGAWCPPCREEFPKMLKAANDDPDVMFLTVSNDDSADKAMQFIKMAPDVYGLKSTPNVFYAWDPTKVITYNQFLTARFPETIMIDPTGHMRRKYPIPVDWDSKEVHDYIKELKAAK